MAMTTSTIHLQFLLLIIITISSLADSSEPYPRHPRHAVNDVCSLTRHRSLCVHSLSSFTHSTERQSMRWWAQAAVTATLTETERARRSLKKLNDGLQVKGHRARESLSDCVECFGDATRQLRQSAAELRRIKRDSEFEWRMNNIETWVSAALTNQDTCGNELEGVKVTQVRMIRNQVLNTTYFSSNALALINKMAFEGGN